MYLCLMQLSRFAFSDMADYFFVGFVHLILLIQCDNIPRSQFGDFLLQVNERHTMHTTFVRCATGETLLAL